MESTDSKITTLPVRTGRIHGEDVQMGEGQVLEFPAYADKYLKPETPVWRESAKFPNVGDIALGDVRNFNFSSDTFPFADADFSLLPVTVLAETSVSNHLEITSNTTPLGSVGLSGNVCFARTPKLRREEVRVIMLKVRDAMDMAAEGTEEGKQAAEHEFQLLEQHLRELS
jgi:hypothetical protein